MIALMVWLARGFGWDTDRVFVLMIWLVELTVQAVAWVIGAAIFVAVMVAVLIITAVRLVATAAAVTIDRRRHPENYRLEYVSTRR